MRVSKIFLTVDVILIKKEANVPNILLIQRKNDPFKNAWALPGGFVDENEDLEAAAKRELLEETSVTVNSLEQLKAFGKPNRDPRGHMVSVAFIGFADENTKAVAADDANEAKWFSLNDLPELAFDHAEIINFGRSKVNL